MHIRLVTMFLAFFFLPSGSVVVVAEWLRRWTRNPLGSPRAGSNPADYEGLLFLTSYRYYFLTMISIASTMDKCA